MPLSTVLGAQSVVKPGVCTSSTRPASPFTGQLIYDTDTSQVLSWNGSAWVVQTGGLVLVKTQTIGSAVSSVAVTSAFSSTYDNYKIVINGGVGSTDIDLGLQLGATTTGYYHSMVYGSYAAGSPTNAAGANGSNFQYSGNADTGMIQANIEVLAPNLAKKTSMSANFARMLTGGIAGSHNGFLNNTTQYTDFTIVASTGTLTGGTIYVYGYAKV